MPEEELPKEAILEAGDTVSSEGLYACVECGYIKKVEPNEVAQKCGHCSNERWTKATI